MLVNNAGIFVDYYSDQEPNRDLITKQFDTNVVSVAVISQVFLYFGTIQWLRLEIPSSAEESFCSRCWKRALPVESLYHQPFFEPRFNGRSDFWISSQGNFRLQNEQGLFTWIVFEFLPGSWCHTYRVSIYLQTFTSQSISGSGELDDEDDVFRSDPLPHPGRWLLSRIRPHRLRRTQCYSIGNYPPDVDKYHRLRNAWARWFPPSTNWMDISMEAISSTLEKLSTIDPSLGVDSSWKRASSEIYTSSLGWFSLIDTLLYIAFRFNKKAYNLISYES